jgi:hypothetical protein
MLCGHLAKKHRATHDAHRLVRDGPSEAGKGTLRGDEQLFRQRDFIQRQVRRVVHLSTESGYLHVVVSVCELQMERSHSLSPDPSIDSSDSESEGGRGKQNNEARPDR